MGVGKGSVARQIVKQSDLMAIDTDDLIESMENRKIKEIFASDGEKYFRDLEKQVSFWLEKNVTNTLISTGGGFFKQKNLKNIGKVVLLDSPFDKIYQRILNHPNAEKKLKKRPLFQDLDKAKELYNERVKQYKDIADIIVDVSDRTLEDIADEIIKKVVK